MWFKKRTDTPHYYVIILLIMLTVYAFFIADNKAITFWFDDLHHYQWLNLFFLGVTHSGDGITLVLFTLLLYFIRPYSDFLVAFFATIFHGVIIYFAKEYIFTGEAWDRPIGIIGKEYLHLVYGMETHSCCTFPSGHTASGFVISGVLCLILGKKIEARWWYLIYLYGFLVGVSRIYLLQHWFRDTTVGALIGVLSFLFAKHIITIYGNHLKRFDLLHRFRIYKDKS